jgi:hypothetical protein
MQTIFCLFVLDNGVQWVEHNASGQIHIADLEVADFNAMS